MTRKTLITTAILAAIGVGLVAGTASLAQGPGPGAGPMGNPGAKLIERFDTDGDGQVTRQEFDDAHAANFADADANGDGRVTLEEFTAYRERRRAERMEAMFQRFDANGDGAVSVEEFGPNATNRFDALDQNADGVVTQQEVAQAMWKHRGRKGHKGGGPRWQ